MVEQIVLEVDGNILRGELHFPLKGVPPYPAVIVCHGIPSGRPQEPGDEGYRSLAVRFAQEGLLSVIFNFRGCGESGGNLDLAGWCSDLKAIIDLLCLEKDVDKKRLSLLGNSGGAAVSCKVAARDKRVSAVVLAACPADFFYLFPPDKLTETINKAREVGVFRDEGYPADPQAWLDDFHSVEPAKYIASIAPRPLLLLHGTGDDLVPVEDAHRLFALAREPKKLLLLDGAGHRLRREPEAVEAAVQWLRSVNGL